MWRFFTRGNASAGFHVETSCDGLIFFQSGAMSRKNDFWKELKSDRPIAEQNTFLFAQAVLGAY